MSVFNTINPFKIKCSGCKEAVHIDKVSGGIAVLFLFAIITPVLILFYGSERYLLQIALPAAAVAEVIYFTLIKFNIVKLKAV